MKKLLCVVFSVIIIISTATIAFPTATADQNADFVSAERFAMDVGALLAADEESRNLPGKESDFCDPHESFVTARLIVKSKYKINTLNAISVVSGFDNLWVLQFSTPHDAYEAFDYYSKDKNVEFVEADKEITAILSETSADNTSVVEDKTYLSWGPAHIGIDKLNKTLVENQTALEETIIAVIDTGVDPNHPFLDGRVLPTRINTSSSGLRNDSMDDNGHGTQIAGVIADSTLNNIYIQPYKVLDNRGRGTLISLAAGISCAVEDGVDIINISLGFDEGSEVLQAAIDYAEYNDIVVVGAAGNEGNDDPMYPASYSNVLKISAVNSQNIVPSFSSYGTDVDFAAPGVSIKTTTLNNGYIITRGTSIAAPFVASIAATLRAVDSMMSSEEVIKILQESAVKVSVYEADIKYGYGVIRAPEAPDSSNKKEKTATPYFSHKDSFFDKTTEIEIFCDTPNSEIYYTTDRSIPSKNNSNAIKYDGSPIVASQTIVIMAVAYAPNYYRSAYSSFSAIVAPVLTAEELTVDDSGTVTSYTGNKVSFTVPEKVNGITVKAVGDNVFAGMNISEIILPKSVTKLGNSAFEGCNQLKTVAGLGVVSIGNRTFKECIQLKNMFFSELESIGEYSFSNVCSKQYTFNETTFSLNLNKLICIPAGAFENSAIANIDLGTISSIGENAFTGCNQLANVNIDNLSKMPAGCFKECRSIANVEIGSLANLSANAFSSCENLAKVNLPNTRFINLAAFENCISLIDVKIPAATTVYSNAFNGCTKLKLLDLPSATGFEATIYGANNASPLLLPENLEIFKAPKMTKTVANMFGRTPSIKNIYLNSATDIAADTFKGCYNMHFLNIQSVEHLEQGVFNSCKIEFIDARNLITTEDMPDNSGILLSNNFIESTDKAVNLIVYGTPGTFVERYSKLKGYIFVGIPLIYNEIPDYVTENSESVYVHAVGFNLTYQWYWNTVKSNEGGTPIENATTPTYTFTQADNAPYYYCIITQNDLGTVSTISTEIITKDTVPADYTEYNKAVAAAMALDRSLYVNFSPVERAVAVDVRNRYSCEQDYVDKQTQAIYDAIDSLELNVVKEIQLYASETALSWFSKMRIITVIQPNGGIYDNVVWSSENPDIIYVTQDGIAYCLGHGETTIKATVNNPDGTVVEGEIVFSGKLTPLQRIFAALYKYIAIIYSKIKLALI